MNQFAIMVLAAGSSSRLGQPKQLLPFGETTLLNNAISEALNATPAVVVVLGSNEAAIKEKAGTLHAQFVFNKDWEEGMASSIRCGLSYIVKEIDPEAVILMVADQPFVTASLLKEIMLSHIETQKPIVACTYGDTVGVPVLFNKTYFSELFKLKGQSGAKKIIRANLESLATVPFPKGNIDIDTLEDYEKIAHPPASK